MKSEVRDRPRSRLKTLALIFAIFTPAILVLGAWIYYPLLFDPRRMVDSVYDHQLSPDHRHLARFIYRENLVEGFYRVTLQTVGENDEHEVAEAVSEGFNSIRWEPGGSLDIHFDKELNGEKTEFVRQEKTWNGITIRYIVDPAEPTTTNKKG